MFANILDTTKKNSELKIVWKDTIQNVPSIHKTWKYKTQSINRGGEILEFNK